MGSPNPSSRGKAFVTGGLGCLGVFVVAALLPGARAYADFGGIILLIVIGGVIGLVVNAIYQRGRRDASKDLDQPRGPIDPE